MKCSLPGERVGRTGSLRTAGLDGRRGEGGIWRGSGRRGGRGKGEEEKKVSRGEKKKKKNEGRGRWQKERKEESKESRKTLNFGEDSKTKIDLREELDYIE